MNISNTLNLSAACLCATLSVSAFAVEYKLPDDGWYQLRDSSTYAELCNSSLASCNVPPGDYLLINHSVLLTDDRHTTHVTITEDQPEPESPPHNAYYSIQSTVVQEDCLYGFPGRPMENDDQPCIAQCPDSYALTGGSCRAWRDDTYIDFGPGGQFGISTTVRISTLNKPTPEGYSCELDMEADYVPDMYSFVANNFTRTQVEATAICATIVSR